NLENVQYDAIKDRLVVIDWSLSPLVISGRGTFGPIEWDVSWFIRSIFMTRPYHGLDLRLRRRAADLFLLTYFGDKQHIPRSISSFLSVCYDFCTPRRNPKISWHLYARQTLCRCAFHRYVNELNQSL